MKRNKKIFLLSVISIIMIVGFVYMLIQINEQKKQWCTENPIECAKKAEETRKYLENERKKELNCGITMPGYDQGWGGWRCKYEE